MGLLAVTLLVAGFGPDYFPLEVGNQWTLQSASSETLTIEVLRSRQHAGITWYLVSGYANGPRWVRKSASGELFALNERGADEITTESLLAHLAPGVAGYRTALSGCKQAARPSADSASALTVGYSADQCRDIGITRETYAPGVGLTRRSVTTFRGEITYELVSARLR